MTHRNDLALECEDALADRLLRVRGRLGHHNVAGLERVCLFRPELHQYHVSVLPRERHGVRVAMDALMPPPPTLLLPTARRNGRAQAVRGACACACTRARSGSWRYRVKGREHRRPHADCDIENVLVEAVQQAAELLTPPPADGQSARARAHV